MIDDANVGEHPWMHFAFELNEHPGLLENEIRFHSAERLINIPFPVAGDFWKRVNVVQNRIGVPHIEVLPGLYAHHVRLKLTADLIERRSLRARRLHSRRYGFDPNENVGQAALAAHDKVPRRESIGLQSSTRRIESHSLFRRRYAAQNRPTGNAPARSNPRDSSESWSQLPGELS